MREQFEQYYTIVVVGRGYVTFCMHVHCAVCQACVLISKSEHNERRFSFFYILLFIFLLQCIYDESRFFLFVLSLVFFKYFFFRRERENDIASFISTRRKYNICARAVGVDHDDYDEVGWMSES